MELALICSHLQMPRRKGAAEERHRTGALVEDSAETRARGVTVDDELVVEVGEVQHRRGGYGSL
jgi:hypothetical protein